MINFRLMLNEILIRLGKVFFLFVAINNLNNAFIGSFQTKNNVINSKIE